MQAPSLVILKLYEELAIWKNFKTSFPLRKNEVGHTDFCDFSRE